MQKISKTKKDQFFRSTSREIFFYIFLERNEFDWRMNHSVKLWSKNICLMRTNATNATNAKFRNFENDRLAKNGKNLNSL